MMMSGILKSMIFIKTQKSRYLKNGTLFFLQIKKLINYTSRAYFIAKNSFAGEVIFKLRQTCCGVSNSNHLDRVLYH